MDEYLLQTDEFRLFRQLVYQLTGISLAETKRQLVQSRLQKRLRHYHLTSYRDYYNLLIEQGEGGPERTEFINCITTNKTDFFREPHHFEYVAKTILPEMRWRTEQEGAPRRIRVWHAGCSTGEEPYTLAMTLQEALGAQRNAWDVRQLASDIDTNVLAHAARGVYERERVEPVPPALLGKYFLRGKGEQSDYVKVKSVLRDQIAFRQINLLEEPWPIRSDVRFDIIFCRNVIIYFDKPTRRRLFARFAELLKPGGYLFLGHSESLIGLSDAFESLNRTIYQLPDSSLQKAKAA